MRKKVIKNNSYKKNIRILLSCIIVLIVSLICSVIFNNRFTSHNNYKVFAYVYDGEKHDAPPEKDNGYVIDEVSCDKAKGAWNNEKWELTLTEMSGNFHCSLKFKLLHPYHKLLINPNGGTYDESTGIQEKNIQETYVNELSVPTRKGHTFKGWEVSGKDSSINGKTFVMGTENTEVKATWEVNTYNVEIKDTFTCDDNKQVKYNNLVNLCTPIRDGYTFTGWDITSGTIDGNSFIVDDKDATITAKWQINNYDYIVYHKQQSIHGDYVLKESDTFNAEFNSEVSPEVKNYDGFTSPSQKTITIASSNNEVNYEYTRNKYNLSLVIANDVSYSGSKSMQLFFEETTTLSVPKRTGYNFKGWDKTSGEIVDNTFKMNISDAVLTPKWEAKEYIVTFNGNEGSINQTTKTVTYDQEYGTLASATRSGYNFLGWYTDPTNGTKVNSTDIVKITDNQTLYAHWQLKQYTINYNTNGGSISSASTTVYHGGTISSLPTPTKSGQNFGGWYKSNSFNEKVTEETVIDYDIGNIYARWYVTPTLSITSSQISNGSVKVGSDNKASVTWNINASSSDNFTYTYEVVDYNNQSDKRSSASNMANGANYSFTQSYSVGRHLLIVQATNQYGDKFYESYFFIVTQTDASGGGLSGISLNSGQTITVEDPGVYDTNGSPLSYISGFTVNIPSISGHSSSNSDTFNLYGWNGSSWVNITNFRTNDGYCNVSLTNKSTSGSWQSHISGSSYSSSGTFSFPQKKYYKIKFVYYNAHASCAANANEKASYTVNYEFIQNDSGNVNMESLFN